VCRNAELRVEDIPEPVPGAGQVLVAVERCRICGSDLRMRRHCDYLNDLLGKAGADKLRSDTRVVSQPMLRVGSEIHIAGLSPVATGGYAERMLLQESALFPVPSTP
jgi:NADPH:quinone reductase-like Zn-dependent oxidoreductase